MRPLSSTFVLAALHSRLRRAEDQTLDFLSALKTHGSSVRLVTDGFWSSVVLPSHIASDSCPPDLWCAACLDEQPHHAKERLAVMRPELFRRHGPRHHRQCSSLPEVSEYRDSCAAIFRANSRPPLVCSLRGLRPCLVHRQEAAHAEPKRILTLQKRKRRNDNHFLLNPRRPFG